MPKKFNITELDFDQIKQSLKRHLSSQQEFTDYDFEGSGMAVLIDLLAYNTHYNAFYLNMLANESFLDSATMRESVVSIAKSLGYTPRSVSGSKAIVNLQITPNDLGGFDNGSQTSSSRLGALVVLPKGSVLTSELENKTYSFVTTGSYTFSPVANTTGGYLQSDGVSVVPYYANEVEITQGVYTSIQYIYNSQINEKFIIPNINIDTSTIFVLITDVVTGTASRIYTKSEDYAALNSESYVFFLQEVSDERYEIYFGDGIVGKKPDNGSIIDISYVASEADVGNGATLFNADPVKSPYYGINNSTKTYSPTVTTIQNAFGGAPKETIDSIKYLAPLNFEAQNRLVTTNDYVVRLQTDYPQLDAIQVWGGENNNPPNYGKVYISMKPKSGLVLSDTEKEYIKNNILKTRNVIGTEPIFVDPDFLYIEVDSLVKWDSRLTSYTDSILKAGIVDAIYNWGQETLEKFDTYFRYSLLLRTIDEFDSGIKNNLTKIRIRKDVRPKIGISDSYILDFSNSIYHPYTTYFGSVTSSIFIYAGIRGCALTDDNGILKIKGQLSTGDSILVSDNAGTVNYITGKIILTNFLPDSVGVGGILSIYASPESNDVVAKRNQLITIKESDIKVRLSDDASSSQSTIASAGSGS